MDINRYKYNQYSNMKLWEWQKEYVNFGESNDA